MADTDNKIRAKVLRTFNDAGSETTFTGGQDIELSKGDFANYQAAGLVVAIETAEPADTQTRKPRG